MEDITPGLLKNIQKSFETKFDKSSIISKLYEKVRDGTATYVEANEFAIEIGAILAEVFKENVSADILPDRKMYYNIAKRIIEPTMINGYDLISEIVKQIQKVLNEKAGIGLKAVVPDMNLDRIDGIVNKISTYDNYDDAAWLLDEPVRNFAQSIVDDFIRANAEFQFDSGLYPIITRKVAGDCCEWCKILAGTYRYPNDVPKDIYRRHQRCRCVVVYDPKNGRGKVQDVWSKKWRSEKEEVKFAERKKIGLRDEKKAKNERIKMAQRIAESNLNKMF